MRLDRSITLNLIRPFRAALGPQSPDGSLPILMYHSISETPEANVSAYYRVTTTPVRFREQMRWLKANGFHGVNLSEGLEWSRSQGQSSTPHPASCSQADQPHSRPVALTFDDGFRDFHSAAFPILREFGFSATMFLPTAFIGDSRRAFSPSTLNSRPSTIRDCLTWAEVRELHRAGIEFGSHTVTHSVLYDLSWQEVEGELRDSKSALEDNLGAAVKTFAYPFAFPQADRHFTERFCGLLARIGYESCATTAIGRFGLMQSRFQLPRLPVNSDDDQSLFLAKLAGHYDWLAAPQAAVKQIKHAVRR